MICQLPTVGSVPLTLLAFIAALSVIVFIHEYGHYIVGRWCGIHAEVFSLGFGPVLISWRHSHIPALARALAGEQPAIPKVWPDERFDLVWIFASDTPAGPWRFSQIPQRLFAHDRAEGI